MFPDPYSQADVLVAHCVSDVSVRWLLWPDPNTDKINLPSGGAQIKIVRKRTGFARQMHKQHSFVHLYL